MPWSRRSGVRRPMGRGGGRGGGSGASNGACWRGKVRLHADELGSKGRVRGSLVVY